MKKCMDIENIGSVKKSGFQPGIVSFFLGVVRASDKKYSYLLLCFIFLMEPLFVVAKIIGSPGKNGSLRFHSKLF